MAHVNPQASFVLYRRLIRHAISLGTLSALKSDNFPILQIKKLRINEANKLAQSQRVSMSPNLSSLLQPHL